MLGVPGIWSSISLHYTYVRSVHQVHHPPQENSESDIYVEATRGIGRNAVIGQCLDIDQSQLPKIFRPIPVVVST